MCDYFPGPHLYLQSEQLQSSQAGLVAHQSISNVMWPLQILLRQSEGALFRNEVT